jgi:hypothetical protein
VVHATRRTYSTYMGGGLGGITGQSDEDSTVRDTGQLMERGDTSLVSGEGGAGCPVWNLVCGPLCKTRSACHEETLTGNAKREPEVCWELRPYITAGFPRGVVRSSHCWLQGPHPFTGL